MKRITIDMSALGRHVKFKLDLDPEIKHHAYLLEHHQRGYCYEEEIAWVLLRTLKPGDFAIDVGANLGFFSLLMSSLVGEEGEVLAIEPAPASIQQLHENLALNAVENVCFVGMPLWKAIECKDFFISADDQGGSALWDPGKWWENAKSRLAPKSAKFPTATLDSILADEDRCPTIIKIDTEGADQAVLEGAAQLLKEQQPPYIIVELNPFGMKQLGYSTAAFRDFMKRFGYDLFLLQTNDGLPAYVPDSIAVVYEDGCKVKNVMFSTLVNVAKAWPEVIR